MEIVPEPKLSTNHIQSALHRLENGWNSADTPALAELFLVDAWIIDADGNVYRHMTEQLLKLQFLMGLADDTCYCILIVEHIVFLAEDIGYVAVKITIRDGDAETPVEGRCILVFRRNAAVWRIQLLHITIAENSLMERFQHRSKPMAYDEVDSI